MVSAIAKKNIESIRGQIWLIEFLLRAGIGSLEKYLNGGSSMQVVIHIYVSGDYFGFIVNVFELYPRTT
jgi:hypothetical protein